MEFDFLVRGNAKFTTCSIWLLVVLCGLVASAVPNSAANLPSSQTQTKKSHSQCSRTQSKVVREYFVRVILPIYHKYSVPVPEKCPFSPLYDIYHYHENNKTKVDSNRWKCEICGKTFVDESYLDKHFDSRHKDSLQKGSNAVCLANYCRIFRCDVLTNPALAPKKCYESVLANLRNKCKSYVELCIPKGVSNTIQNQLTVEIRENLCGYLKCARYNELPSYMTKGPSFFMIFGIVFFIGMCIIAYGVINHTDWVYDENEDLTLPQNAHKKFDDVDVPETDHGCPNTFKPKPELKYNLSDLSQIRVDSKLRQRNTTKI